MAERPNILLICTDQQRFDTVGALGNELVRTPHIDGLVEGGVSFTNAFCQSPVCTPSRASFLTGRYPRTTRCRQNGQKIPGDERLISRILADHGYRCGLSGKLHLSSCANGRVEERIDDGFERFAWSHHPQPDWEENGYTQWLKSKGTSWEELYGEWDGGYVKAGVPGELHQTTWCANVAMEFMREAKGDGRPWFFNFNCFDPHHPFDPPREYLERYRVEDMPLPRYVEGELEGKTGYQRIDHRGAKDGVVHYDYGAMTDDDRRAMTAAYYAMVELIDENVGRMIGVLKETGQLENTVVVFMSDHGEMLGDHGIYLKGPHFYDEAVRVPLVFYNEGMFTGGHRVTGLTELVDLAPTLLDAVGVEVPERMQGRSLMEHLKGAVDGGKVREDVFSEYYNSWTHERAYGTMLRTERYKVVVYHRSGEGELYDLEKDPGEHVNLYDDAGYGDVKAEMLRRCFDRSVLTMDPCPPRLGPF